MQFAQYLSYDAANKQTLNFAKYERLPRFGLSPFFDPLIKSLKFETFVEKKEPSTQSYEWLICEINNNQKIVINIKKVAIALKMAPEKIVDSLTVSKIKETFKKEIDHLTRSIKEPELIDAETSTFAELLFDQENQVTQVIEQRFAEEEPIKLVAFFNSERKIRIIRIDNYTKLGFGTYSLVIKVVDISKGVWTALKYSTSSKGIGKKLLKYESKAFSMCYGKKAKEGEQHIGWEIKPSELFKLPLDSIEPNSKITVPCIIKTFNDKKDLLNFIDKGNVMSFEAIINCFFQLVIGLARFSSKNMFHLDISPENVWLRTLNGEFFDCRIGDLASLNSKENLKENSIQLYAKKTAYRKCDDDISLDQLMHNIQNDPKDEDINNYCELAKKIDVFSLGACLYILVNQRLNSPFYLEMRKIDENMTIEYAGTISYFFKDEFLFMKPLFDKIFANYSERISAEQLAMEFYQLIKTKFPDLAKPFFPELQFLMNNNK